MTQADKRDRSVLSSRLPGTWRLESRIDVTAAGERLVEPSLGDDPVALLFYDRSGHFAAQFMKRDRSVAAPDGPGGTPNNSRAQGGYDAYFGTYTVDDTQGTVTQRLVGALSAENVGSVLTRAMEVQGDHLTIRLQTNASDGTAVTRTLTWKRVAIEPAVEGAAPESASPHIVEPGPEAEAELNAFLDERIYEFNTRATGLHDGRAFAAVVKDAAGSIVAAVNGHTWGGSCYIAHVWVDESKRGRGMGRALLPAAEAEGVRRGCTQALLLTHSFQAPIFYERLGYARQATVPDYPRGHAQFVYLKRLGSEGPPVHEGVI